MKNFVASACLLTCVMAATVLAQEPEWNPARVKECDRTCLINIMDGYMSAIFKHDPKAVPALAKDVRMTENTAQVDVGEGVLWRSKVEPTSFKIYVADPAFGQVAIQTRLKIQGRDALVAVRLKIDRGKMQEIEQLYDRNVNEAAIELLTTPRPGLVNDLTMETFGIRDGLIHEVEAFPFVTVPYGWGNGWTMGSGR
jgi:hypothetical protein